MMKSLGPMVAVVLVLVSTGVFAQSDKPSAIQSDAQEAFAKLKTLDGYWEGPVITDLPQANAEMGKKPMQVTLRTTSRGNALMHEMTAEGSPDDPITMLYLDEGRLLLTHYCDAGNRPRMVGKMSPDGKRVEFEFLDIAGNTQYGYMNRAVFTLIDENHHTEEWTFMLKDRPVHARFDLQRKN